jgi:hypothetical protein
MNKKTIFVIGTAILVVILLMAYNNFFTHKEIKDTKTIHGLIFFKTFAADYTAQLKDWSEILQKYDSSLKSHGQLKEYADYLSNNNSIIENKIGLLTALYNEGVTSIAPEDQIKFRDFEEYTARFFMTDSAMHNIVPEIERIVSGNLNLKENEIRSLKSIHDQILFKNLQVSLLEGDAASAKEILSAKLYNSDNISYAFKTGRKTFSVTQKKNEVLQPETKLGTIISSNSGRDIEAEFVKAKNNTNAIYIIFAKSSTELSIESICNIIFSNTKLYDTIILGINFNDNDQSREYLRRTIGMQQTAGSGYPSSGCSNCHKE